MKNIKTILLIFFVGIQQICFAQQRLNVIINGLSHDHVNRMLQKAKAGEISLIGIIELDQQLCNKKKTEHQLPDSIFFKDLSLALKKTKPDLVMVYKAPSEHFAIIETCLPLKIAVMLEKPVCVSNADAKKIKILSAKYNTKVFTNYPSIWYTSFIELLQRANEKNELGIINKMEMRGGHAGPIEIGCSKDFTNWLTDPSKNGGGAIIDFGCYGASIMTALMNGKAPLSVYAITKNTKPKVYTNTDDDATIVLEYAGASGVIEASWNWPYTIMDVEAYGPKGYLYASEFNNNTEQPSLLSKNDKEIKAEKISVPQYKDEVAYLTAIIKTGVADTNKLLSLEHNVIVVKILNAAIQSAKEGKKIIL